MASYQRLLAKENVGEADESDGYETPSPARSRTFGLQVYIAVTATLVCFLQVWLLVRSNQANTGTRTGMPSNDLAGQRYSRNYDYMSLDHQFDHLWHWENHAYIRVQEPEPELDIGEQIPAAISMFHQLHCLSSFRTALQQAREGGEVAFDHHENFHWPHCLDYLRNTIFCFADTTLELPRIVNGTIRTRVIDGSEDSRQCRSAKAAYDLGGVSWSDVLSMSEISGKAQATIE